MTDRLDFERRLEERLRARAALASRSFDATAIAHRAIVAGGRRRWTGRFEWPTYRPAPTWLIVGLLLALGLLGAVVVGVGALLRERPPVPPSGVSNGLIAVSANPWTVGSGENGDIYLVSEGNPPRRIIGSIGDGVAQACPRFSPDGRRLAFGESRASGSAAPTRGPFPVDGRAIVVVGVNDHGDPTQPLMRFVLPPGLGPMVCPEWSPSGRFLAFSVDAELRIVDIASGETRVVPITRVTGAEAVELEWSRDGSKIAVAEPGQIRVIDVDGGGAPTVIPVQGAEPRSLGWTAGDHRIVYVSVVPVDENATAVYVVDLDGRNDTQLSPQGPTAPGLHYLFEGAVVSPDGTQVAYLQSSRLCTNDGCGPGPTLKPIVIAALDGSNRVEMSVPADLRTSDGSEFSVAGLQWSPDGKRLLLSSIDGVSSVGLGPGSPAIRYADGDLRGRPEPRMVMARSDLAAGAQVRDARRAAGDGSAECLASHPLQPRDLADRGRAAHVDDDGQPSDAPVRQAAPDICQ